MEDIFWSGTCDKPRIEAIAEIEIIVNSFGFIVDHKEYSDLALMLKIELTEANIDSLHSALRKYISMDDFEALHSSDNRERVVFLNVSFGKGTGLLEIEVPAIPG